ncbi:MAG: hypothetical protein KBD24_04135 [Candidatus Pacebacteria bacterium]|nr:hypothetical protein [Candidatus Paceibacterota bacterium]
MEYITSNVLKGAGIALLLGALVSYLFVSMQRKCLYWPIGTLNDPVYLGRQGQNVAFFILVLIVLVLATLFKVSVLVPILVGAVITYLPMFYIHRRVFPDARIVPHVQVSDTEHGSAKR